MRHAVPIHVLIEENKPHRSKEWIEKRKKNEEALKAGTDKIKPPTWLSYRGKKIFDQLAEELLTVNIINNLDVYTLAILSDSIDKYSRDGREIKRLQKECNTYIKHCDDHEKILEKTIEVNKLIDRLIKGQLRLADNIRKYAIEFGLTPQSRARLAIPRETEGKETSEFDKIFGDV